MGTKTLKDHGLALLRSPILPFAALSVLYLWVHEPWRDETEAWIIARDPPTLGAFFQAMRYEGTPALWHLMLRGLSHLGFSFWSARILHAALATAVVALLWFRSPFRPWEAWLIAFGYYFAYEYDAITRSYALLALALFAVAALDRHRHQRPLLYGAALAILANVTLHGLIIACVLAAAHGVDVLRRRAWTPQVTWGGAVAAAGFALAIYGMRPPADLAHRLSDWHANIWDLFKSYLEAFIPVPSGLHPFWNTSAFETWPGFAKAIAFLAVFGGTCWSLRGSRRALGLFLALAGALEILFVFKYYAGAHHAGLLLLVFIACLWIAREAPPPSEATADARMWQKAAGAIVPLLLVTQVAVAAVAVGADAAGSFSGSGETAHYLERNAWVGNGTFLAFYRSFSATSVLAQLHDTHVQVFSPEYDRFLTYTPWAQPYQDGYHMTWSQVLAKVDGANAGYSRTVLVVYDQALGGPSEQPARATRLATFGEPSIGSDEVYDIFLIAPAKGP
jgi:hypothetical protein